MARGHAKGHHQSPDETLAMIAINIQAVLAHNVVVENSGGPIGPAAPVVWDSAAFITKTGKVKVTATMSVTGTGGTSSAADVVNFQLRQDGAAAAGTPIANDGLSATALDANGALTWIFSGLTVGSSHTFGIMGTNTTDAGDTLVVPAFGAALVIEDSF